MRARETVPSSKNVRPTGYTADPHHFPVKELPMKFTKPLSVIGIAMLVATGALAQQPTRIVVPFAPGGNTDLVARMIAERLTPKLGGPVIVENKTGAGALVGSDFVAKAAPDGRTLLLTTVAHAVGPSLRKSLPYDSLNGFTPLYVATLSPQLMLASKSLPANTLREFISLAQSHPGQYRFGSSGTGSALHIAAELLRQQAKLDLQHIPYKGTGQSINDVIAGHIDFIIDPIATAAEFAKSGRVKVLGITSAKRSALLPDVPTFKESGLPEYECYTWAAILGPKGMKPEVAQQLNTAISEVMGDPVTRKRFMELGMEPVEKMSLEEADRFIRSETKKWAEVIRAANIQPE
jgi:tripartite-type tricarboxylate transporter receptor subunit TctC